MQMQLQTQVQENEKEGVGEEEAGKEGREKVKLEDRVRESTPCPLPFAL